MDEVYPQTTRLASRRGVEQHVIYLRPTDYGIAIVRILHQRMDAGRQL